MFVYHLCLGIFSHEVLCASAARWIRPWIRLLPAIDLHSCYDGDTGSGPITTINTDSLHRKFERRKVSRADIELAKCVYTTSSHVRNQNSEIITQTCTLTPTSRLGPAPSFYLSNLVCSRVYTKYCSTTTVLSNYFILCSDPANGPKRRA